MLILIPISGCGFAGSSRDSDTLYRAERELVQKDYAEARRLAQDVSARGSDDKKALLALGWSEFKLGNYRPALVAFVRTEAMDPRNYDAQSGIAWTLFKMGDLAAAEVRFQSIGSRSLNYWQRWDVEDGLGWIAYARGDFEQAEKLFRFSPRTLFYEDYPYWVGQKDGWVGRGMISLNRNRPAEARKLFAKGVKYDPDYFRHFDGLARTAHLKGRHAEALEHALNPIYSPV